MYMVHIPERPEVDPVLRSTLESAELVRDELNTEAGSQSTVIDLISTTVRFTPKGNEDE